jgi:hypothetical protein
MERYIMDARIGTYNGAKPTQTVCGNVAVTPFLMTIGLGNGYYCVRDIFPCPNWQEVVGNLREIVAVSEKKAGKSGLKKSS